MPETFAPYTPLHALTLAVCLAFMLALSLLGLRLRRRSEHAERRLRLAWATLVAIAQVVFTIYWALPERYDVSRSLPLHLCDLAGFLAPIALALNLTLPRILLYFWGLGLSSIAFFSPIIEHGPAHSEFWIFWISHTMIVGSALYLLIAARYRPTWRHTLHAIGVLIAYVLIMALLNAALNTNYGYVGPSDPDRPMPLDGVGPWPLRLIPILAVEIALMLALYAPWAIANKRAPKQQ